MFKGKGPQKGAANSRVSDTLELAVSFGGLFSLNTEGSRPARVPKSHKKTQGYLIPLSFLCVLVAGVGLEPSKFKGKAPQRGTKTDPVETRWRPGGDPGETQGRPGGDPGETLVANRCLVVPSGTRETSTGPQRPRAHCERSA